MFMNKIRLLIVTFLTVALAVLGSAAPGAFAASSGTGPAIDVSSACAGQNTEVEQAASLIPHKAGNWGDRDFIAAGRGGTVYVTWDYGPSAADVKIVCASSGSCAYSVVDATAVIQKSTDHGKTWGPITPMQPGFPAGGGYFASILVQPNGVIDALILDHPLNPHTFAVHPGHELFTSSSDGGKTWAPEVKVGGQRGNHLRHRMVDRRQPEHGPGREPLRHLGHPIPLGRQ